MPDSTTDPIEDLLLDLFRSKVKKKYRDHVRPDARLQADLNMDSLGVLSAMLSVEEDLKIQIFPLQDDVKEIRTVGDIVKMVRIIRARAEM